MISKISGKRITVTGGAGFLGSHVVPKLRAAGALVAVPRRREYDLVRMQDVRRLYDDTRPDLVLHLAARTGGIGAKGAAPAPCFYDNLMMGVQLMHEGFLRGIEKLVAVASAASYPKNPPIPFKEDDLWDGYPDEISAPVGLAKKMLLVQSQAYRAQYGFNSVVLFPATLYGPGDCFDPETSHVIPAIVRRCVEARERGRREIWLWGDGTPTREFLFVEDAAEGLLLAIEAFDQSDPVNLGTGYELQIRDLAAMIAKICGYSGRILWDVERPNGQPRRCLDISRAHERFGFLASTRLEDGLERTLEWFLAHRDTLPAPGSQ